MLDSQDCSQLVRDIYRCFGIDIPRNTNWQYQMPVNKCDLTVLSEQEKAAVLDSLPTGTILQFLGHEMIYLGKVDGRYYTINDVSTMVNSLDA